RIYEALAKQRRVEEILEVLQGKHTRTCVQEGHINHLRDGQDQKGQEKDGDQDTGHCGARQAREQCEAARGSALWNGGIRHTSPLRIWRARTRSVSLRP